METKEQTARTAACGCAPAPGHDPALRDRPQRAEAAEPDLGALIPIAVVIAAGCEPCAEKMVRRALEDGASVRHVRKVLGVVGHLQGQDCFADAVGAEAVRRMDRPLARGKKTLEQRIAGGPDLESVVDEVRKRYAQIAINPALGCGCGATPDASAASLLAREIGYTATDLDKVAPEANLGLGCGAPIHHLELQKGETLLDLGSGAGLDACLAASKVGSEGKVIGVDMTPEMLERARETARRTGLANVEFLEGRLERLPLPDRSVDAVTSNCVVNLVPDKRRVFEEIVRVLKPGGRLVISDIVLGGRLPEVIERSLLAWVGCVAGALPRDDYFSLLHQAGLQQLEVLEEIDLSTLADGFMPQEVDELLSRAGVTLEDLRGKVLSLTFRAVKP